MSTEDSKILAVIYARVSSDRQDVDLSISAQLKALREYAERNGYGLAMCGQGSIKGPEVGWEPPPNSPFLLTLCVGCGGPILPESAQRLSGWSPEDSSRRGDKE